MLIRYDDLTYLGRIVSVKVKNMKYRLPQIILCNSSTFRGKSSVGDPDPEPDPLVRGKDPDPSLFS
jgi:hypothetical protein